MVSGPGEPFPSLLLYFYMSKFFSLVVFVFFLFQAGCVHSSASRLTLGAVYRTPTFDHAKSKPQALNPAPQERSGWSTTIVIAPVDGIAHNPTGSFSRPPRKGDRPRIYGLMPTAESALDFQGDSWVHAVFQTFSELGASVTILVDPVILWHQSTTFQWSPQRVWKRSAVEDAWSSGLHGGSEPILSP